MQETWEQKKVKGWYALAVEVLSELNNTPREHKLVLSARELADALETCNKKLMWKEVPNGGGKQSRKS